MRTKSIVLAGIMLAAFSGTAAAHGRLSFGISIGVPAPVYVAPAPVYYPPPAYYYYPAPRVVYYPPVYYAPPPVFVAPARVGVGFHAGFRTGFRAHRWR